jgi:hypothetical protein
MSGSAPIKAHLVPTQSVGTRLPFDLFAVDQDVAAFDEQ